MKRFLCILVWTYLSVVAQALNLPVVSTANLSRIEAGLQYAKSNSIPYVRFNCGMPEATVGATLDTYAIERTGQLCKLYGRKVIYGDYAHLVNTRYWRTFYAPFGSPEDTALWNQWKIDDAAYKYQDLKNPAGLYPWAIDPAITTANQMYAAFIRGYGGEVGVIRQIDNEPGNVLNSRLDPTQAYGAVSPAIRAFLERKTAQSSGTLASTPWETESYAGLFTQMEAENKRWWWKFSYQSLNWYLTPWKIDDTPDTWGLRCAQEIKAFIKDKWWPGRPVILSELGAIGCPQELRLAALRAFNRVKPYEVKVVCWFSYDDPTWGIVPPITH